MAKDRLKDSLKKLKAIVEWFDAQGEVDVEAGLEKVKEGVALIKESKSELKKLENEFEEVKKEFGKIDEGEVGKDNTKSEESSS